MIVFRGTNAAGGGAAGAEAGTAHIPALMDLERGVWHDPSTDPLAGRTCTCGTLDWPPGQAGTGWAGSLPVERAAVPWKTGRRG